MRNFFGWLSAVMWLIAIALFCWIVLLAISSDAPAAIATGAAPEPTPTPVNYDKALAQKWERIATAERAKLVKHCKVLGKPLPAPMPVLIGEDLYGYAMACKAKAEIWHARTVKLHHRLTHPGGSGALRWKPLALLVGWPSSQIPTLIKVIWRESNGQPRCFTPPYGAAGLMQFLPQWFRGVWWKYKFNPYDPEQNLKYGLKLWQRQGGSFLPAWSLTAW